MKSFDLSINTANLAVAVPTGQRFVENTPVSVHSQVVAPVSVPNYLGGATIMLALVGMLTLAAQAAGFTSKSVAPKQTAVKGRSFSNHQPHTSH